MGRHILFFCISIVLFVKVYSDYTAAVVEYVPIISSSSEIELNNNNKTVESNLLGYIEFIRRAHDAKAQIIVFPEYGLTGRTNKTEGFAIHIPDVGDDSQYTDSWLEELSKAAIEYQIYVAVNFLEKIVTVQNETIYHNTVIVFNKGGRIVAKYRKINLYQEPALTPGSVNQTENIFTTEYGVTFGVFTSEDILFYYPSRSILSHTVTDVIYPSSWTSRLPFYHSLSTQIGYAMANKINLLAANLNDVKNGRGGSGIYGQDGTVYSYFISGLPSSKLLVSLAGGKTDIFSPFALNPNDDTPEINNYKSNIVFDAEKYKFKQLTLQEGGIKEELCHKSFCCQFNLNVTAEINQSEVFQLVAFDGREERPVRFCALLACESTDPSSCGTRKATGITKFKDITITNTASDNSDIFYQPVLLRTNLLPVLNASYTSSVTNGLRTSYLKTRKNETDILVFGIMGVGGAPSYTSSLFGVIILSIFSYLFAHW